MRKKTYAVSLVTWWIALILAVVALITYMGVLVLPLISAYSFWLAFASAVLLLVANRIKTL
jgi:hypothetical protein